jgi:hypothetical protein
VTAANGGLTIAVDASGTGSSFVDVAVLSGYATSGNDPIKLLIDSSQLSVTV